MATSAHTLEISAYPIYQKAVDMLLALQASDPPAFLAQPDAQDLAVMITPAFEFYKGSARVEADQSALLAALTDLLAAALQSAPVLALRDYHAENLLYLPARRGAALVGSLLIAAVPSSPIESDGFPTSPVVGRGRRRRSAGCRGPWGRPVLLVCYWVGLGGAASDGCFRRSHVYRREFEMSVGLQ